MLRIRTPLSGKDRAAILCCVALAMVLPAWAVAKSLYLRWNYPLYVVNALAADAVVEFPGGESISLKPMGTQLVRVPVGSRTAMVRIAGRPPEQVRFTIHEGFFRRLGLTKYILNVGGGGVFLWEEKEYSSRSTGGGTPYKYRLIVGPDVIREEGVQYCLEQYPSVIQSANSEILVRRVDLLRRPPERLMRSLVAEGIPVDARLDYLETHLLDQRENDALLSIYRRQAVAGDQRDRAADFLGCGLRHRPTSAAWHLLYQDMRSPEGDPQALRAEYDDLLSEAPDDSVLLYLRGRIGADPQECLLYLDRALEKDAANHRALFAKAGYLTGMERFAEAEALSAEAARLSPEGVGYRRLLRRLQLANGRFAEAEEGLRGDVRADRADWDAARLLLALVNRRGAQAAVTQEAGELLEAHACALPESAERLKQWLPVSLAVETGDATACRRLAEVLDDPALKRQAWRLLALIEHRPEDAEKLTEALGAGPAECLQVAVVWAASGDRGKAADWLGRVLGAWSASDAAPAATVRALFADGVGTGDAAALRGLPIEPELKALVYCAFAGVAPPGERHALLEGAERCNFSPEFPHRLIADALAKLAAQ